jgi:hypothetical protein
MQTAAEEGFQMATIVVVVLIVLVCMALALIFINPQVSLNPLKPPLVTVAVVIAELPPTWTPTPTNTPTLTATPTPTFTPTNTPTFTPIPTDTPPNTPTRTATRRPTPRPATPVPTVPSFAFRLGRPVEVHDNCGTWYLSGSVWNSSDPSRGTRSGMRINVYFGNQYQGTDETGSHDGKSPGYWEWIFANGTAGNGYVVIVDSNGNALSPQIPFRLTANCNPSQGDAVNQVVIDFVGN